MVIGLPPIMHFASPEVQARVIPPCLSGDKRICLAISEPFAGSDVASIKCTAEKIPDGRFYKVNGVKKWITGGQSAEFFTVAVRTGLFFPPFFWFLIYYLGGPGIDGISLLLIERGEGVDTNKIKTSYSSKLLFILSFHPLLFLFF